MKLTLFWILLVSFCQAQDAVKLTAKPLSDAEQRNLDLSKNFPKVAQQVDVAKFDLALLTTAAEKGNAWAQFYLGKQAYFNGKHKDALKWYRKSAAQGHAPSMVNMGAIHEHGLAADGKPDFNKAIEFYDNAANLGHPSGFFNLACIFRDGSGVEKDEEEAFSLFMTAAALAHPDATNEVGISYEHGRGIDKNAVLAIAFYQQAKKLGSVIAISNLGATYVTGSGVIKDEKKAVALFKESAEKKCPHGSRMLGLCYEQGIGVKADLTEAKKWFKVAADMGDQRSKDNLKRLSEKKDDSN